MSEARALVSVVIPTHDRTVLLLRSVRSVLAQSYPDLEVVVVDDASGEDIAGALEGLGDRRVRCIRREPRAGAASARNAGIREARGGFIAFQDSDDEWLGEKLARQMAAFGTAGPGVGVVYCGFIRCRGKDLRYYPSRSRFERQQDFLRALLSGNFVSTQTAVVRRECFEQAGMFDESLPRLQDWDLFIRLAGRYGFHCVDEPLVLAHHGDRSITADRDAFARAMRRVLETHAEAFAKYPGIRLMHRASLMLGARQDAVARFLGRNPGVARFIRNLAGI